MHFVSEFLPCAKSLSILKCRLSDIGKRLLCKKSLVGSERNVREREQSLHGRGFEDMFGHIFIDKIRFFLINIKSHSKKLVIPDTCNQVFGADQAATGGVYENDTVFHPGDTFLIDHMVSVRCEWAVKADQVTGRKKCFKGNIVKICLRFVWIQVVGEQFHAEAAADTRHGKPDLAGSDDPGCFSIQVHAHETIEGKVVFPAFDISFVGMTVGGEDESHCKLGDRFRRIAGNAEDFDAAFGSSFEIYIIITGTAHQDQTDTLMCKFFDHFCSKVCVYKSADPLVTGGEGSSLCVEICFNKSNVDIRMLRFQFIKKSLVIISCTIK